VAVELEHALVVREPFEQTLKIRAGDAIQQLAKSAPVVQLTQRVVYDAGGQGTAR
jgi:hypothetical protein